MKIGETTLTNPLWQSSPIKSLERDDSLEILLYTLPIKDLRKPIIGQIVFEVTKSQIWLKLLNTFKQHL